MQLRRIESVRGAAALYVLYTHLLAAHQIKGTFLVASARFGQEAVMAFFLISGFVIFYAFERSTDKSFATYFGRRSRRIYPIFLLALGVSAVFSLGREVHRDLPTLIGNVLLLQDSSQLKPGVWFDVYAGNLALWSLSYEWWFYLFFFPIRKFIPDRQQKYFVSVVSTAAAAAYQFLPNQAFLFIAYFAIWWTGAELARSYATKTTVHLAQMLPLGLLLLVFATPVAFSLTSHQIPGFGLHPFLEFRHAASAAIIVFAGLIWRKFKWIGFNHTVGLFTVAAPISYAIYVFHFPIITSFIFSQMPWGLSFALQLAVVIGFSWFAEGPFQKASNRIFTSRKLVPI